MTKSARSNAPNSLALKFPSAHELGYMPKKLARDIERLISSENEQLWDEEWEKMSCPVQRAIDAGGTLVNACSVSERHQG